MTKIAFALAGLFISLQLQAVEIAIPEGDSPANTAQVASSKYFGTREHDECTELTTLNPDDYATWQVISFGGANITGDFKVLHENKLDEVSFGQGQRITFNFTGRNVVPQTFRDTDKRIGFETNNLNSGDGKTIGKMFVMTDNSQVDFVGSNGFSHFKLKMAILYTPKGAGGLEVPCEYVSGPIDFTALDAGKCLWVDSSSKSPSGKRYCW